MTTSTPSPTDLLRSARTIAVYGMSDRPYRISYSIGHQLIEAGYTVYPVNPTVAMVDGEPTYPTISSVPEKVDIVNVFRQPRFALDVVNDAIAAGAKAIWFQLGTSREDAISAAREAGLIVIVERCIAVDLSIHGIRCCPESEE
jgi:predicted CoA-binding protein